MTLFRGYGSMIDMMMHGEEDIMKRFTAIAMIFGSLAGCATSESWVRDTWGRLTGPVLWDRPATTGQQFLSDRYACLQEARDPVASKFATRYGSQSDALVNGQIFDACMAARSYTRNPNGQFGPPAGGAVAAR